MYITLSVFFLHKPKKLPPERYGFKTPHNAPLDRNLINFESDITHLISNLEFKEVKSPFQNKLKKDVQHIKSSPKLFVSADKTSNVYEVSKESYNRLLHNNITAHYEKAPTHTEDEINQQAKRITECLEISNCVEPMAHQTHITTYYQGPQKGFSQQR